ncbi:MAG: M48 family metallopeptidase [Clostridiaceae bacterium]|nr:M48 family metallopeptidase [Clostridiaceae bacterium]
MNNYYKKIPYRIIRSQRKSLALTIDKEGRLIVRAPISLSNKYIRSFIKEKERWIREKQSQARASAAKYRSITLDQGEKILYLGEHYTVRRQTGETIAIEGDQLLVPDEMTAAGFAGWLREQAGSVISERVDYYAGIMGVEYTSVKMSGAKQRWGSCGAGDTLNFAWRLVLCPRPVIDYVVVHELCHIIHKDHSANFWTLVSDLMPDYKLSQKWLRQNRALMDII